jgi:hypothetical protein
MNFRYAFPLAFSLFCCIAALGQNDITNHGGAISCQYTDSPSDEGINNLIDNRIGTKYLTFHQSSWIEFKAKAACVVKKYAITSANDSPERDPVLWTLEGSGNGTTWEVLDSRSDESFSGRFIKKEFTVKNDKAYQYYRLQMNTAGAAILQLAEWELYDGSPASVDPSTHGPQWSNFEKNGYKVVFVNDDTAFNEGVKQKMLETFFTVYPQLIDKYNPNGMKEVTFFIDPSYQGVAEAANGTIRFSPAWFRAHPGDIDVVTHESMHIIQSYPPGAGPSWLTEGIADYVRYKYGVDNVGAGWSLPKYTPTHNYTNSYRITARFLAWLEINGHASIVTELDSAMRTKTYSSDTWKKITGKTIDELWLAYTQNPVL